MLTVRDLMRTDVVTAGVAESARTLARILVDAEVSGVPVVDAQEHVVGVASATDLVRLAADEMDVTLSAVSMHATMQRAPDPDADPD